MTISARRQRTRTALQEAALVVFARRGVAGASIEEICEEGGFTRGAFYSNYATKDELVLAIIDEEFALAVEGASGLIERLHGDGDLHDGPRGASGAGDGAEGAGEQEEGAQVAGAQEASAQGAGAQGAGAQEASAQGAGAQSPEQSPEQSPDDPLSPREVLRRTLEEFRFPFSSAPARIIAMRDIELHSLRHPQLRARLDDVMRSHKARLHAEVSDILTHYGARSTIPLTTLIDICHSCYDTAATEAVVARPDAEVVTVDRTLLLTVLIAFVEFPDQPCPGPAPSASA
ncbi:TetR family transcriptional regulator [Brevibacterium yomogidense]|uniref:TetR family transcriptional regulator n=1 Tax=Brevibacterium yomogidense TaxID=946573 RepID=UPI002FCCBCF0